MPGPAADLASALPRLDGRTLARAALALLVACGLWWAVRGPYARALALGADPLVAAVVDTGGARATLYADGVLKVNTGIPSPGAPPASGRMLSIRNDGVHRAGWSIVFLWALVALVPWRRLRAAPWRVAGVLAAAWALQVATLALEVIGQVGKLREAHGVPFLAPTTATVLAGAGEYLKVLSPFLPALLWIPVAFSLRRAGTADAAAPVAGAVPRNAPCPCGSGKKHKHCCGAERARAAG